jgi:hypothetical protein
MNRVFLINVLVTRWWYLVDMRRCFLANLRSFEITEFHDLHTQRNLWRDLTRSLHKIVSSMISKGISVGGGGSVTTVVSSRSHLSL